MNLQLLLSWSPRGLSERDEESDSGNTDFRKACLPLSLRAPPWGERDVAVRKVFMELRLNLTNREPVLLQRSIQIQTST